MALSLDELAETGLQFSAKACRYVAESECGHLHPPLMLFTIDDRGEVEHQGFDEDELDDLTTEQLTAKLKERIIETGASGCVFIYDADVNFVRINEETKEETSEEMDSIITVVGHPEGVRGWVTLHEVHPATNRRSFHPPMELKDGEVLQFFLSVLPPWKVPEGITIN